MKADLLSRAPFLGQMRTYLLCCGVLRCAKVGVMGIAGSCGVFMLV